MITYDAYGRAKQTTDSTFYGASYTTNAGQTITNNSSPEVIDYEDMIYDPQSLVTTGASWKFTAPVAGYYHIDAMAMIDGTSTWAVGERGAFWIYVNGVQERLLDRQDTYDGTTTQYMTLSGSITLELQAGDYIDIRLQQNSGGNLSLIAQNVYNWVNIEKVG